MVVWLMSVILIGCGSVDVVGADSGADLAAGFSDLLADQGNPGDAPVAQDNVVADAKDGKSDHGPVPVPMSKNARVVFLHHSTGGVIWEGGVAQSIKAYNAAHGTAYTIHAPNYPDSPYPWENYPYDYWRLWVKGGAGMAASLGVPTLESFAKAYDVVVFKHCFPVSDIEPDSGNPDIGSEKKTIENYKLQYNAIRTRLRKFKDTRFIVWTGAARVKGSSNTGKGKRSREFFTWVKQKWDQPGDNIFVWDFFELETEGGNFLLDKYAASPGDSHPNSSFAKKVAPYFAQRIIDVIEGRGDTASITGH